jgi:hypothetical protein
MRLMLEQLHELGEYVSYFLKAKTDSIKFSLRKTLLRIVLAGLGIVAFAVTIVTGIWLLFSGLADGLAVLFGGRPWVGNSLTGMLLLAGVGFVAYRMVVAGERAARERTVEQYEKRQAQQQKRFGRNVSGASAAAASEK